MGKATTSSVMLTALLMIFSLVPGAAVGPGAGAGVDVAPGQGIEAPASHGPTGTPADTFLGVNDLNDGWVHTIEVDNAETEAGLVQTLPSDAETLDLSIDSWWLNEYGQLPSHFDLSNEHRFPILLLAFASAGALADECPGGQCTSAPNNAATFYAVDSITNEDQVTIGDDGHVHWNVPIQDIQDAMPGDASSSEGFAIWYEVFYNPEAGGGSADRADRHDRDTSKCTDGQGAIDNPWECPSSGALFNPIVNELFFAGFGDADPYDNDGDASGTPYGVNDQVLQTIHDTEAGQTPVDTSHTGPLAELGLKGQIDRLAWTFGGAVPAAQAPGVPGAPDELGEQDATDAYATIIDLGSSDGTTLVANEDGNVVVEAWVSHYTDSGTETINLSEREGEGAFIAFANLEGSIADLAADQAFDTCSGEDDAQTICGEIGDETFQLNEDGDKLTITVPVDQVPTGEPVAIDVFIDVTDETGGLQGNYEPGNGLYNAAKLTLADDQAASVLDAIPTPVVVLEEEPAPPEPPSADLLTLETPQEGDTAGKGETITVEWNTPVNDPASFVTGQNELYRVEVFHVDTGTLVYETTAYTCQTNGPADASCTTTVDLPTDKEGEFNILVRATATQMFEQESLTLCMSPQGDVLGACDNVTIVVDTNPPAVEPCVPDGQDGCRDELVSKVFQLDALAQDDESGIATEEAWVTYQGLSTARKDTSSGPGDIDLSGVVPAEPAGVTVTLNARAVDNAGLEAVNTEDISFEATPPTISELCPLTDGACESPDGDADDDGSDDVDFETSTVNVRADAFDDGSGLDTLTVWASGPNGETDPVEVPMGQDSVQIDLVEVLENPADGVYRGDAVFHAQAEDNFGSTSTEDTGVFEVNTHPEETIALRLLTNPDTFRPNGDDLSLTYEAEWIGGPQVGEPASDETVTLSDGSDSSFELSKDTDLNGLVTFDITDQADVERVFEATVVDAGEDVIVIDAPTLTVLWTDIQLERVSGEDTPAGDGNYADPGDVYSVAYKVTQTHQDTPVEGAKVTLTDGSTHAAFTNADGLALVPVVSDTPAETTYTAETSYDPDDGPEQTASIAEDVTVRWAKVVYTDLTATHPDTEEGWHDLEETVTFSWTTELDFGAGTTPAEGAVVDLVAGDQVLCEDVTVDATGEASCDVSFAEPTMVQPALEVQSTPQGVTTQDDEGFGPERWAKVVFTELTNDAGDDVAWHDAASDNTDAETVTFGFEARLLFGDSLEDASIPAADATVDVTAASTTSSDTQTCLGVTIAADGSGSCDIAYADPAATTPTVTLASTTQGVSSSDANDFGEHRWGKVVFTNLADTSGDDGTQGWSEVAQDVDFSYQADIQFGDSLSEDSIPAEGALVHVAEVTPDPETSGESVAMLCSSTTAAEGAPDADAGAGSCSYAADTSEKREVQLELTGTIEGISAFDDNDFGEQRWTEIALDISSDDTFVNPGDEITFEVLANWSHDEDGNGELDDPVTTGSLELTGANDGPSTTCDIADGEATCTLSSNEVYSNETSFEVTSTLEGVTRLLENTVPTRTTTWTQLVYSYTTDEDSGTVLDHQDAVTYTAHVEFAHNGEPVQRAAFSAVSDTAGVSGCLTNSTGDCVFELSRESGEHTFSVDVYTFHLNGGLVRDIDAQTPHADSDLPEKTFRWTSIGFLAFECQVDTGSGFEARESCSDHNTAETAYPRDSTVRVIVTAVAEDSQEILTNADVKISGQPETTDENGEATNQFAGFFANGCTSVTARGESAEIDGQNVTWDTPRTEEICFEES